MKPGEEIRLVKENLTFAVSLWEAAASGLVPPEPILRPPQDHPQFNRPSGIIRNTDPEVANELSRGAANQMRAAFALSAIQAQRSMAAAFPGEPIEEEWLELRTARSVIYLIGLAVERSILQPVWECPPPYRRHFHIRRLGFTLNAAAIEGRMLSWDDFGGLKRYLVLLDYCADSANAAVKSGARGASRRLPEGPRPSRPVFGGVIGVPPNPGAEAERPPVSRIPRGYRENSGGIRDGRGGTVIPGDSWDASIDVQAEEKEPAAETVIAATPDPGMGNPVVTNPVATRPVAGNSVAGNGSIHQPAPWGNVIQRFVAERCEMGDDRRMLAGELYAGFVDWCQDSGLEPVSQRAFGMRLTNLGMTRKRRGHGKHWWVGIRLSEAAQAVF